MFGPPALSVEVENTCFNVCLERAGPLFIRFFPDAIIVACILNNFDTV